jgi:hypothetical protein
MEGEKKVAAMEEVKGKETTAEAVAADVSLKQLSKKLDDFAKERDWEKHHSPRNLLLAMVCFPLSSALFFLPRVILLLLFVCLSTPKSPRNRA